MRNEFQQKFFEKLQNIILRNGGEEKEVKYAHSILSYLHIMSIRQAVTD